MINTNLLYGVFEFNKIEVYQNGELTPAKAKSGMVTFTRDHKMAVVSGTQDGVMAYAGTFEVKDDTLLTLAESCVFRELEGTTISRKILKLDEENLVIEVRNDAGGMCAKLSWKRKVSL